MEDAVVPVTAEWALWGRKAFDREGYRSTFAVLRLAGQRDYFPAGGPA
jgi:hypothetical protein